MYHNLDIYVPSMIPAGGAHVKHPECARAARILGVDYADAVTGFTFKGRHGTAIINGAVVAAEYASAIQEIIGGFEIERIQAEEARKTQEALRMWRRFMAGLRIRERIEGYSVEGEADAVQEAAAEDESMSYEAGGFFPTGEVEDIAEPNAPGSMSQNPIDSLSIGFSAKDTGTARDNGLDAQRFAGSPSPRPDRSDDRLDDKLNFDVEEARDNNDWSIPDIEVVYGKSILSAIADDVESIEAGGFMMEDNPEAEVAHIGDNVESVEAGGFMDEDNSELHAVQSQPRIDDALALSNLADDDLAQAITLQQTFEGRRMMADRADDKSTINCSQQPDHLQVGNRGLSKSISPPSDTASGQAVVEVQSSSTVPRHNAQDQASESDGGSLLSEDPDDEDADPEWLV